jgi:hypothetical protein
MTAAVAACHLNDAIHSHKLWWINRMADPEGESGRCDGF